MRVLLAALLTVPLFADGKGDALLKNAQAQLAAGEYPAAIRSARDAVAVFQAEGDFHNVAHALTRVGLAQLYSGDYTAALATFDESLEIARSNHDTQAEAESWNSKGAVFYEQGRYSAALDSYREALRLAANAGRKMALANIAVIHETLGQDEQALDLYTELLASPERMAPQQEAQLLSNIGTLRRKLGDPQKALATYREAQALYRRDSRLDGEIAVLINIGIVQALDLHDLNAAIGTFSDATDLAVRSRNRPLSVQTRLYRGEAYFRANRLTESEPDFEAAARDAKTLGKTGDSWKALYGLARIAFARGETAHGRQLVSDAVSGIEALRSGLLDIGLRPVFLADKRDVYDLAIGHTEDPQEVFRLLELSRGRLLRDRSGAGPPDLRAIAARLPGDTAILEYWMAGDGLSGLFWIVRGQWGWRRLFIGAEAANALRDLPSLLADSRRTDWRKSAQLLATDLLPATGPWNAPGIRRLAIVADGALHRVPLEVLPLSDSQLLIEKFQVYYLPSAASFQNENTGWRVRWPWQNGAVEVADPEPNPSSNGLTWPRLPEARREVLGIARYLNGKRGLHLDRDAQRAYLAAASATGVLHLATHAVADTWNPAKSYILFAASTPNERYDPLYLKEVFNLPLKGLSLATLSACETSVGKQVGGEGVDSFNQAFLAAGARSVVASLWRVDDAATADLMLGFYGRLAAAKPKAQALQQAKLTFLHDPRRSHPAYWAAFVLSGDGSGRLPYSIGWLQLVLLAAAVCAVAVAIRMKAGSVKRSTPPDRQKSPPSEPVMFR